MTISTEESLNSLSQSLFSFKVNKLFSFFLVAVLSKRNRKHVLEKAVETLACTRK